MNENLSNALANILTSAQESVEKATSFLSAQIPDVVHQLLLWKFTESLISFSICLLWIFFMVVLCIYIIRKILKSNLSMDNKTNSAGMTFMGYIIFSIPAFCNISLTWLKIWPAPKLYLLEYAASLIHK